MGTTTTAEVRKYGVVRTVALLMVATLSLLLVVAMAAPEKADAHQVAGRTVIYLDGEKVKSTKDDHFVYRRTLAPGCHTVRVVQKQGDDVTTQQTSRVCSDDGARVVVEVDDSSVRTRVSST